MEEHHEWYCLGKGFDLSRDQILPTNTFDLDTRQILLNPMPQLTLSIPPNSTYSTKTTEMTRQETQKHKLDTRGKLRVSAFENTFELDFGIHQKTTSTGSEAVWHKTEQVHSRTLYFDPCLLKCIPIVLANLDLTTATDATKEHLDGNVECLRNVSYLSQKLNKIAEDEKVMEDGSLIKKIEVCRQLLMSRRVDKATHFVSSVYLGAKTDTYSIMKTAETTNETGVNAEAAVAAAALSFGRQKQSEYARKNRVSGRVDTKDTSVQITDGDTKISRAQEKVILVKFSPISGLVGEMWKDALEMACRLQLQFEPGGIVQHFCVLYI